MLLKSDLKEIRNILREEIKAEAQNVEEGLQAEMKINLVRILSEVRKVKDRLKNIEIKTDEMQKDLAITLEYLF
jgi:hypothetical protein